jgi:hypothetical protein
MAAKKIRLEEHAGRESRRERIHHAKPAAEPSAAKPFAPAESSAQEDDLFGVFDVPAVLDARAPHEPDPHEIDDLTDRIFGSVLSRYGWARHDGRIEHVGEPRPSRH